MIGILLRNKQNEICFARVEKGADIVSFHYTPAMKILNVLYDDKSEEMFTSEVSETIHQSLKSLSQILVTHMDSDGNPEREYLTPLTTG